jgi:ribosomal protein L11 methyltransferase
VFECRMSAAGSRVAAGELLNAALQNLGVAGSAIAQQVEKGRVSVSVFGTRARMQAFARRVRRLRLAGISVKVQDLSASGWSTKWKRYVKPFDILPGVRIVPRWKRDPKDTPRSGEVFIDTTMAFGTGLHATTRLTAQLLKMRSGALGRFLDVGAGSGILSVLANRFGARQVWAIDVDAQAVETCRLNLQVNGCDTRHVRRMDFERFRTSRPFDFVAANLITQDLLRFRPALVRLVAPGGCLAISGIYKDNYARLRRGFKSRQLRCVRVLERDGWYGLLFERKAAR